MRPSVLSSLALLTLVVGCKDSSTTPTPTSRFTHPNGTSDTKIIGLGGRPFGLFVTSGGNVLVTEQDLNLAVRVDSLGGGSATIAVGHDPGDVVANDASTIGYVSGFFDGTVSVVDLGANQVLKTLQVSPSNAYRLVLSKDGTRLYVTSTDGYLYTINTATQTPISSLTLGASQGIAINHAGSELYVTSTSGTVWRLDLPNLTTAKSTSLSCVGQDVALSKDDAEAYLACEDGNVVVLDATTLATKGTIAVPGGAPFGLAVTPDNAQIYVASARTHNLTIIDRASHSIVNTLTLTGTPRRVGFNTLGNKAYVSNEGNWVDVIE
jgi:DNA-binding beta-propeller fold protein YncE